MPLDVIGDEIVLDGQTVARLVGRAAETTTLNQRVREMLNGEHADEPEEKELRDFDDDEIMESAEHRGLITEAFLDLDDEEFEDLAERRRLKRAA